jgi:hypothetical protein
MKSNSRTQDEIIVGWLSEQPLRQHGEKREKVTRQKLKDWLKTPSEHIDSLLRLTRYRLSNRFLDNVLAFNQSASVSGFTAVAMCSLMIETIGCYRFGLPGTDYKEDRKTHEINWNTKYSPILELVKPTIRALGRRDELLKECDSLGLNQRYGISKSLFWWFFKRFPFQPVRSGLSFYANIRCGLLHQGETKGKWLVSRNLSSAEGDGSKSLASVISAPALVEHLTQHVESYLSDIRTSHDLLTALVDKLWFVWWHCGDGGEYD